MQQYIKKIGDENVVLQLWVFDANGDGVPSLSPLVSIRRTSDDMYLDFADNTFKSSGWTTRLATMTEVNASLAEGCYKYAWNSSLSVLIDGEYSAEYDSTLSGYGKDADFVSFMLSDISDVRDFLYNKRKIDKTLAVPTEVLYEANETTEKASWELTHSETEDSRTPV